MLRHTLLRLCSASSTQLSLPRTVTQGVYSQLANLNEFRSCGCMLHISGRQYSTPSSQDEEEDDVEGRTSERVKRIAADILELTLLEISDLTELLKKRLGLPDFPMMGMGMPMGMPGQGQGATAAAAPEPEKAPEKTEFDVKLEGFDAAAKIKVIKEIRGITGLGLKESKDLVEGVPAVVKKGLKKEEAEELKTKLEAAGAKVVLE